MGARLLQPPGIEVSEVFTLPFAAAQVEMDFHLFSFFKGVKEGAAVLHQLEFDKLRVVAAHDLDHELPRLKGTGLVLGVVFFDQLSFYFKRHRLGLIFTAKGLQKYKKAGETESGETFIPIILLSV